MPEDIRQEEVILLLREILNTQRAELGMNDPISEESAYRLAKLLEEIGRFSESEQLYRDVLAIKRSASNKELSDVADSIECLASVLEKMNRQNEAEPLYRESLELRRSIAPDKDDPQISRSLENLARVLEATDRYSEAETIHRKRLEISRQRHNRYNIAECLERLILLSRKKELAGIPLPISFFSFQINDL